MKKMTRIFGILLLCLALVGAMSVVFSAEEATDVTAAAEEVADEYRVEVLGKV